jgi:hypothetical protein
LTAGYLDPFFGEHDRPLQWWEDIEEFDSYFDPCIYWTLVHGLGLVDPSELRSEYFERPLTPADQLMDDAGFIMRRFSEYGELSKAERGQLFQPIREVLWPQWSDEQIREAIIFARIVRTSGTIPISSTETNLLHLKRCAAALLPGSGSEVIGTPEFTPSVEYRIPSLAHISLDDIIRIRLNEDIFEQLRLGLVKLTHEVHILSPGADYRTYETTIRELADEIVRPLYDSMEKKRKRATTKSLIWGYITGRLVSLGVTAAAGMVGGPVGMLGAKAVTSAANAADSVTRKRVGKLIGRNRHEYQTACSVLYSLLD